jgi:hypothetical protein
MQRKNSGRPKPTGEESKIFAELYNVQSNLHKAQSKEAKLKALITANLCKNDYDSHDQLGNNEGFIRTHDGTLGPRARHQNCARKCGGNRRRHAKGRPNKQECERRLQQQQASKASHRVRTQALLADAAPTLLAATRTRADCHHGDSFQRDFLTHIGGGNVLTSYESDDEPDVIQDSFYPDSDDGNASETSVPKRICTWCGSYSHEKQDC